MCRHPCEFARHPLRGPGADPPGLRWRFGVFAEDIACGFSVRHYHGSQSISDHFQKETASLGIQSSPAFIRAPEVNGCVERPIRMLKENLLWVRTFETIRALRQALLAFRDTYNTIWLIERRGSSVRLRSVRPSFKSMQRRRRLHAASQKPRAVQRAALPAERTFGCYVVSGSIS
jgi:hypothetical protein